MRDSVKQRDVLSATSDMPEARLINPTPTNLIEGIQETLDRGKTAPIRGPGLDNQYYSAPSQIEEPDDFTSWHGRDPKFHAVISALVLAVEKKNKGKQRSTRALIHLANNKVYFLSVGHTATEISTLLDEIGHWLISISGTSFSQRSLEVPLSDYSNCPVLFLDRNPNDDVSWDLEKWRMQHILELVRDRQHLPLSDISAHANDDFFKLKMRLDVAREKFLSSLNLDILYAQDQPRIFDIDRYNYLAHPDPTIRRNRRQAAEVFPLLVGEILNQSKPSATQLGKAIDSGRKIIEWITQTYGVRPAVAKSLRFLSENEIGIGWRGKLQSLLFLLSTLPPERYPRSNCQWKGFNEALGFIRSTTKHPTCSTSTGILLGDIARRNWLFEKNRSENLSERADCIEKLIKDLGRALAAYIRVEKLGAQGHPVAQAQTVASNVLIKLGLRKLESLAKKWQTQKRNNDFMSSGIRNGRQFPVLLPAPIQFYDLKIVQLVTQTDLTNESTRLGHCVESYGPSCHNGQSVIFSVRDSNGQARSTFELAVKPLALSHFETMLVQHKGSSNAPPPQIEKAAVSAFVQYLRGTESIPLLMKFSREKVLINLGPDLSNDYRYAELISTLLADSTHGRIRFEELISSVLNPHTPASIEQQDRQ